MRDRQPDLAAEVTRFPEQMPSLMTEREWLAGTLVERIRSPRPEKGRVVELLTTRHFLRGSD